MLLGVVLDLACLWALSRPHQHVVLGIMLGYTCRGAEPAGLCSQLWGIYCPDQDVFVGLVPGRAFSEPSKSGKAVLPDCGVCGVHLRLHVFVGPLLGHAFSKQS